MPVDGSSSEGELPFSIRRAEILADLKMRGFRFDPRKGQNFLFDGNLLRALVRDAGISPDMPILEIGPGAGTLTRALLAAGSHVTAVEIDPILAGYLRETFSEDSLHVVQADALETKNRLSMSCWPLSRRGSFKWWPTCPTPSRVLWSACWWKRALGCPGSRFWFNRRWRIAGSLGPVPGIWNQQCPPLPIGSGAHHPQGSSPCFCPGPKSRFRLYSLAANQPCSRSAQGLDKDLSGPVFRGDGSRCPDCWGNRVILTGRPAESTEEPDPIN